MEPADTPGNPQSVFVQIGSTTVPSAVLFGDPVCHMIVTEQDAAERISYFGQTYYFCNINCLLKFNRRPDCYVDKEATLPPPELDDPNDDREDRPGEEDDDQDTTLETPLKVEEDPATRTATMAAIPPLEPMAEEVEEEEDEPTTYTCPMHPQVVSQTNQACPLCGMGLEPLEPTITADEDHELRDMQRRFQIAVPLTIGVFVTALPDMIGSQPSNFVAGLTPLAVNYIQLALTIPIIWVSRPFFARAVDSIKSQNWNMFTLIGAGVAISFGYSLIATLLPGSIPQAFGMHNGMPATYFEPAAVITALALLGQVLELKARKQTNKAVRDLLHLTPPAAHFVKLDFTEVDIPVGKVAVNDKLRVRPGEQIPTDGIILEGRSTVDESMVTGESKARDKVSGDTVIGGTTNQNGTLVIKAQHVGKKTLVARIARLVMKAQRSRAPIQNQVDKIAAYFVPAVIAVAVLTFIIWAMMGPPPALAYALLNAIAVLIIACPCALGLATPMSITVAMGRGARSGLLVRDAQALEKLSSITTLVVDKTGTITEGRPTVSKIVCVDRWAEGQLMMMAAAAEAASEHPVGRAIVEYGDSRDLADCKATNFVYQPGGGVTALVDGHELAIGSAKYLRTAVTRAQADLEKMLVKLGPQMDAITAAGGTPVLIACDGDLSALLTISDQVRTTARSTVKALNELGIKVVMLTGDQIDTARNVAEQVGIADVTAEVSPAQKHDYIVKLQEKHGAASVAMAGDGINDSPALAQAAVGIAMGSGTNIAIESADIVLVHGDLEGILRAVRLSHAMKANIKQNLILAFGYNALAVPIAAGLLYPITGLLLNPMVASLAMSFSSVSVILNALRLRKAPL